MKLLITGFHCQSDRAIEYAHLSPISASNQIKVSTYICMYSVKACSRFEGGSSSGSTESEGKVENVSAATADWCVWANHSLARMYS